MTAQQQLDCISTLAGQVKGYVDYYIPGRGCNTGNVSSVRLAGTASELLEGMSAMDGAWSSGLLVRAAGRDKQALGACSDGVPGIAGCPPCLMSACSSCCGSWFCCVFRRSPVSFFIMATNVALKQ